MMRQRQKNTQRRTPPSPPDRSFRGLPSVDPGHPSRAGFTLIEMLVSTALIVIVMLMFAQVYQVAASSVGTQKGIVENDQRSRTLTTVINNDIAARTFRYVLPIHPTLETTPIPNVSLRTGYFYISENDPLDDMDDVLAFTVGLNTDDAPLTARATKFGQGALVNPFVPPANYEDGNQPEADDGQMMLPGPIVEPNNTGSSQFAEISYFLRNGNLYRRVLLIRKPYSDNPPPVPVGSAQPPAFQIAPADYPAGYSFWNDFDYSAFYLPGSGPQFHNATSGANGDMDNDDLSSAASFGFPHFRFGHDHVSGNPREYDSSATPLFLGRFTQEETSATTATSTNDFVYPGSITGGSPMSTATAVTLDSTTGTVTQYAGGSRRGEDILLSHVHSFDVKVFDQAYDETGGTDMNRNGKIDVVADGGAFADVGHMAAGGDYRYAANLCPGYGPKDPGVGADGQPGVTGTDDNGDGTADGTAERGWPGSDDGYGVDGQPGVGGIDDDGINGVDDAGELGWPGSDDVVNRIFDTWHHALDFDNADGGAPGGNDPPPYWPNDGGAPPNGRPLKAIQITIRFLDTASGQMRQVTLVESLVD